MLVQSSGNLLRTQIRQSRFVLNATDVDSLGQQTGHAVGIVIFVVEHDQHGGNGIASAAQVSQWDFFHMQMRLAVTRRNFRNVSYVRKLQTIIVDHLESLPDDDPLRQTELVWHLIGTDDRLRTARYYADDLSEDELAGATRTMADYIVTGADLDPKLVWVTSLLDLDALSADQTGKLCNRYQFDLLDALENDAKLPVKIQLIRSTRSRLERLAAADPSNAGWQRDLVVSNLNLANIGTEMGDALSAQQHFHNCHTILQGMRDRGMYLDPPIEQLLQQLDQLFGD